MVTAKNISPRKTKGALRDRNAFLMESRVRNAVNNLLIDGKVPSFYSVASMACVARSTLYRKKELRRLVEEGRDEAQLAGIVSAGNASAAECAACALWEENEAQWRLIRKLMFEAGLVRFCKEPAAYSYAVVKLVEELKERTAPWLS